MGKTNEEIKQLKTEELTMYQQIAVEAEVITIMDECDEDDEYEKRYFAFLKLALCDEKYLLVYKNEFKKYLDADIVDELAAYRYTEIVPAYLFIKKYVKELKGMVGVDCGSLRIFSLPPKVIQSKFIVAMREMLTYIPTTTSAILDGILAEGGEELSFLAPIVFSLKQDLGEHSVIEQRVGYDVILKLLSTPIGRAPIMNIQIEDEQLHKTIKNEKLTVEERVKNATKALGMIFSPSTFDDAEEEIVEEPTEKLVYVVKKIDKSNNQVVFTKEFDTQQQASDYIKGVVKDYPEIAKRFNFAVELCEAE